MKRAYVITLTTKNNEIILSEHMFASAHLALKFAKSRVESGLFTAYQIHTIYLK